MAAHIRFCSTERARVLRGAVCLAVMTAAWLVPATAAAQDMRGAERIEIDSAIFGGGALFVPSSVPSDSRSRSYTLSGAVTANVSRWVGIEGDLAWAVGHSAAHTLYGAVPLGPHAPNLLLYTGNLVYNPIRSNRPFVPYVTVGAGGLTTFTLSKGSTFGLPGDTTLAVASVGGGIRWFPIRHWGVRGDYRMLRVLDAAREPVPGQRIVRAAHRVYGALVLTF